QLPHVTRRTARERNRRNDHLCRHVRPSGSGPRPGPCSARRGSVSAAVVTGASRGIGRATALGFARRGLDVALLARTSTDLSTVAEEIRNRGVRPVRLPCDVTSAAEVTAACGRAESELGVPIVVVNNAGLIRRGLVHEQSVEDFRLVIDTNLTGTFLVTRALLP